MGVAQQKQDRRLEVFEDLYTMWTERCLTQAQAAAALGVCDRTFRPGEAQYHAKGHGAV